MRILILDIDDTSRATLFERLEEALRQAELRRVELVESDLDGLSRLVAEDTPEVAFLGPGCYLHLEESISRLRATFPRVPLALVLGNEIYAAEAVELRRVLSIRIIAIADVAQLAQFVLDSVSHGKTGGPSRNLGVIAVTQLKGGVGASTASAALASCWAKHGLSVALVDLDDLNPTITVWAKVGQSARKSVADALRDGEVQRYRVRELTHPVEGYDNHLSVLGIPELYSEAFQLKADVLEGCPSAAVFINSLVPALKEEFDVLVVDTGRSWGIATVALLPLSQKIVLVVDESRGTLKRSLENFSRLYRESDDPAEFELTKWSVLVNGFSNKGPSLEKVAKEIEEFGLFPDSLDIYAIPHSEKGARWVEDRQSFYDLSDETARSTIKEIAFDLVPYQQSHLSKKGMFGFLKR